MSAAQDSPNTSRVHILLVLLLGWGLLVLGLGQRSLWVDEFLTLEMIRGSLTDVFRAAVADIHPPLYFLGLRLWTALCGTGDLSLRLFSVFGGMVGLALMPAVARNLGGRRAALPAALLLAAAPAFVEFSRMARYYSWLLALGLLSTKLLLYALGQNKWQHWAAHSLSGLLLVYTFYPSGVLLAAHALLVLPHARSRSLVARWGASLLLVSLGALPWFLLVAGRQVAAATRVAGADLSRTLIGWLLGVAASFYTFGVGETLFPWRLEAWVGLGVVVALGWRGLSRQSGRWRWAPVGLFGLSIALLSTIVAFGAAGTPFLNVAVRGLFALPYFLLVLAQGICSLRSRRWRAVALGVLLAVWGFSSYNQYTERQFLNPIYITPAKEAADFVRAKALETDLVISDYDSVFGHYFVSEATLSQHRYTDRVVEIEAVLAEARPERVWLVTIGRDQTRHSFSADEVRRGFGPAYCLEKVERYLPVDPVYLRVKDLLLGRESYRYRLTVELYIRDCSW